MSDPMASAEISIENVGGRNLRIARWRLDEPSDHPPVLFFNGIGANIEAVAPLAEAMNDRAFIMFDMPGTGGSPDPVIPYTIVTMAWTATQVLDRFGLGVVDVMGISWGGGMAQHFAIQHPARTRRLVLIATSAGMLMIPGNPAALTKMANPRRYVDADYMAQHFETLYGGALDGTKGKGGHMSRLTPPSPRGYMYQLLAMLGWTSAPVLPFMRKETLILMGDDDQIVPLANGKFLNTLIPNSELIVMEGGGHLFLLSHKDESVSAITDFLDAPDETELSAAA
ncbi:alpha/beta fold hydrolase [Pontixanthobacter aestiaquae]|nr:alpha/beta fold hydrolase [Pontixanthobacter aestiaquae]MDN3645201.1 alpha/beta fold hydrolase [Pontixanthobacter aestiaquae]